MRQHTTQSSGALPPESGERGQQDSLQLQLLFAAASDEAATDILAVCEAGLQALATVTASQMHPYPDIPTHHQAILDLQPHQGSQQALEALVVMGGSAWRHYGAGDNRRAIWKRSGASSFLHPEVRWACVSRNTLSANADRG